MTNLSFAKARPVSVAIPSTRRIDQPFDPDLKFNSTIASWTDRPENTLYSLDPAALLERLESDEVEALVSLSLAVQIRKDAAMVWDVVFNELRRKSLIAAVFVADENYKPVARSKVFHHSQFLNLDRGISRLQENALDKGAKVGVSIYNSVSQNTYVLLYTVMGHCVANRRGAEVEGRSSRTSALNLKLDHVYSIGEDDSAVRLDVDEVVTPPEAAHAFVEWLATCVNNTRLAYPWKPHFQPAQPRKFDRVKIEKVMGEAIAAATEITYEEFEDACREVYNKTRTKRSNALSKQKAGAKDGEQKDAKPPQQNFEVPVIEVVSLGTNNRIFARIDGHNNNKGYIFDTPTDQKTQLTETFLFNRDLEGRIITEVTGIFVTSVVEEGKTYILRHLTANF